MRYWLWLVRGRCGACGGRLHWNLMHTVKICDLCRRLWA